MPWIPWIPRQPAALSPASSASASAPEPFGSGRPAAPAVGRPDPCIPASRPAGACSAPAPSRPVPRRAAGEERPWTRPRGAGILNAEVGPDGAFVIEQTSREREAVP